MDKHILVVDDDEVVRGAVCKGLRPDNYAIDTAQSADEALKLLSESSYRLVITDLMMPGMDGLELLQRIHDMGAKSETIMITGYPTIQTALRAKRLGAFEYVTKPFTRQELRGVGGGRGGQVEESRFPRLDSLLEQGRVCGVVRAADSVEHTIHSPLTGRVMEINPAVLQDAKLAGRDPEGSGWLFRLEPGNPAR